MKNHIVKSRFPVLVDLPSPAQASSAYNHCGIVPVHLRESPFQDLVVYVYHKIDEEGKNSKEVKVELKESGWGIPALIQGDSDSMYEWKGSRINFVVQCTLQLRVGSLDKNGLKLPLPFPTHLLSIKGWYDTKSKQGEADYRKVG